MEKFHILREKQINNLLETSSPQDAAKSGQSSVTFVSKKQEKGLALILLKVLLEEASFSSFTPPDV